MGLNETLILAAVRVQCCAPDRHLSTEANPGLRSPKTPAEPSLAFSPASC